jgi:hypothetical protein
MDDPIDRVQLDAEDRAYAGIFRRSGPYGDVPSTHAEIAGDLKGHAPSMVLIVTTALIKKGRIVQEGGSYFLDTETRARIRAARQGS